jgi:hypothetical protein
MGLAAMGAGISLLIAHAGEAHVGAGPAAVYLGGPALFLLALVVTRTVTVAGSHGFGMTLKLVSVAILVAVAAAQSLVPTLVLAAVPAALFTTLVVAERLLFATD